MTGTVTKHNRNVIHVIDLYLIKECRQTSTSGHTQNMTYQSVHMIITYLLITTKLFKFFGLKCLPERERERDSQVHL